MKFIGMIILLWITPLTQAESNVDWSLKDVNLTTHHFPQEVVENKQVTILFFWATWCPYCKQLMPHIQSLLYQYQDSLNLKVYALNINEDADPAEYLSSNGYGFLLFPNAEKVAKQYQVHGTPGVLIFDQKGKQVFDLRSVKSDHLVKQRASHGAKSVRLAPYWAAEVRKALQQLIDEV